MKDLFELCNKGRLSTRAEKAATLLFKPEQINYQDPETGKTPLMAALENGNDHIAKCLLANPITNFALCDLAKKNVLHYLQKENQFYLIPSPMLEKLIPLAFQQDETGAVLWDELQIKIDFLKKISNEMWQKIEEKQNIHVLKSILIKLITSLSNNEEIDVRCLEFILTRDCAIADFQLDEDSLKQDDSLIRLLSECLTQELYSSSSMLLDIAKQIKLEFDKEKYNLLHKSIMTGRAEFLTLILQNYPKEFFPTVYRNNDNIAHAAVNRNSAQMLDAVNKNFGITYFNLANNDGKLPIHLTCGKTVLLKMIELGLDINTKDALGNTVLHYLLQKSNNFSWKTIISHFFEAECDFTIQNLENITPLEIALNYKKLSALKLILPQITASLSKELFHRLLDTATKKGFVSIVRILIENYPNPTLSSLTRDLINHPKAQWIEELSKKLGLHEGTITPVDMKFLIARLQENSKDNCRYVAMDLENLPTFIANLNIELQKQNFSETSYIYYLVKSGMHWICGELELKNSCVKNILIMDPLVKSHPTDKVYTLYKNSFPSANIFLSGSLKQGKDLFCAIYCLDDIEHLSKVRNFLPDNYKKDLYHYLRDREIPNVKIKKALKDFRDEDVVCQLPAYVWRTTRSLNGKDNSYRANGIVFWTRDLSEAEQDKFKQIKAMDIHHNMDKHIKKINATTFLNLRLEYKLQRLQEKTVKFYVTKTPDQEEIDTTSVPVTGACRQLT